MLKIRRPLGRLIFNMGIAIPGKTIFLIETAPWAFAWNFKSSPCNFVEFLWTFPGISKELEITFPVHISLVSLWFWTEMCAHCPKYHINSVKFHAKCHGSVYFVDDISKCWISLVSLQWHHNRHDFVSNHRRLDCVLNRLYRRRSKKASDLRVTGPLPASFVRGIHRWPLNSPYRGPVTRKIFPFGDVIMIIITKPSLT